jgi:anti-anti-sigma regulatory factor
MKSAYCEYGVQAFKMLRITVVDSSGVGIKLHVEGRLTGRGVEELRQSCDFHSVGEGRRLVLDMKDVSFADTDGIELLKDLRSHSVTLVNLVPFLALHLRDP